MPLGTISRTASSGAGAGLLSSAEAAGRGESRVRAAGASWALARHAHVHVKNRKQTPRESAIVGAPIPLYYQEDAAAETNVACRRAYRQLQASYRAQFPQRCPNRRAAQNTAYIVVR